MRISREVRAEHAMLDSISMIDVSIECDRSADPDQSRPDSPRRTYYKTSPTYHPLQRVADIRRQTGCASLSPAEIGRFC